MIYNDFTKAVTGSIVAVFITSVMATGNAVAAEDDAPGVAFPDKYMLRLGAYYVDGSDTQFSVSSPIGLGTVIINETVEKILAQFPPH